MTKKVFLGREEILGLDDIKTDELHIPEWGTYVHVRGLTGRERDLYEESLHQRRGRDMQINLRNARAKLVVLCTVDESGKRLFIEKDIAKLGEKNARALDRIFSKARDLSGLSDDDMEELTKNSDEITFDD